MYLNVDKNSLLFLAGCGRHFVVYGLSVLHGIQSNNYSEQYWGNGLPFYKDICFVKFTVLMNKREVTSLNIKSLCGEKNTDFTFSYFHIEFLNSCDIRKKMGIIRIST